MNYSLPTPTAMQVLWLVHDIDRLHKLADEATPEDLENKYIFRQMRAVDLALKIATKKYPAQVQQKLQKALIQSCLSREGWENLDTGVFRREFHLIRRRFFL